MFFFSVFENQTIEICYFHFIHYIIKNLNITLKEYKIRDTIKILTTIKKLV